MRLNVEVSNRTKIVLEEMKLLLNCKRQEHVIEKIFRFDGKAIDLLEKMNAERDAQTTMDG